MTPLIIFWGEFHNTVGDLQIITGICLLMSATGRLINDFNPLLIQFSDMNDINHQSAK